MSAETLPYTSFGSYVRCALVRVLLARCRHRSRGDKRRFGDRTSAHDYRRLVHALVALTTRRQRPGAHGRTHPSHGAACARHGAQHPGGVLVASPEAVLHVVERRVERDDRSDVRLVGEDELLEARDDLVVGHRQRVDVEAEHACDHLAEVQQLNEHREQKAVRVRSLYTASVIGDNCSNVSYNVKEV